MKLSAISEKVGSLGTIMSAMGCASCFAALGIAGPLMVLATLYLFWTDDWSNYMFYFALALMLSVSLWDFYDPPGRVCLSGSEDLEKK